MKFCGVFVGFFLMLLAVVGCSDESSEPVAGIEIGNPALAFTADFTVDYSEVEKTSLAKSAAKDEPVLLDSFTLDLHGIRSYSSYYVSVSIDPVAGLQLWPYESAPEAVLPISFTEDNSFDDAFSGINLQDEGFLKEMGVSFAVPNKSSTIQGRILVGKDYVPFEYSLCDFVKFTLRYHYSQIERVSDSVYNLSVMFRVRHFVDGLDLTKAEVSEDGIIRFDTENNKDLWSALNDQFLPSFQALRYEYMEGDGDVKEEYVLDIWEEIVGSRTDNVVSNSDFSNGSQDWILMNQFGGFADSSIVTEKDGQHIMKVDVKTAGRFSYSVQLIHENIGLVAGKKYKCVFTIWSDKEGEITARIGSYATYETIGFQEHIKVPTSGKSVEIEFTPEESTPFARFEMNLGNSVQTYYVKDVQIYRLSK